MKRIIITITAILSITSIASAQLNILPNINETSGADVAESVKNVSNASGWNTIDAYYQEAVKNENQAGKQIASGVMTRNTILDYAAYLVRFVSQIGLIIGAMMIIWAGYEYATYVFTGNAGKASSRIRKAIIGVIIIIFSYAIMRIITTAFLS